MWDAIVARSNVVPAVAFEEVLEPPLGAAFAADEGNAELAPDDMITPELAAWLPVPVAVPESAGAVLDAALGDEDATAVAAHRQVFSAAAAEPVEVAEGAAEADAAMELPELAEAASALAEVASALAEVASALAEDPAAAEDVSCLRRRPLSKSATADGEALFASSA